jgi:4-carboxymuconolactone decarboxylase
MPKVVYPYHPHFRDIKSKKLRFSLCWHPERVISRQQENKMSTTLNRDTLTQVSPKLAELSQQVLFDDIWRRPRWPRGADDHPCGAGGTWAHRADPWHIDFARQNGVTDEEIAESFTHLAFYAGWPAAVSA